MPDTDHDDATYRQALRYAEDLSRLYREERTRTKELEAAKRSFEKLALEHRLILDSMAEGIFGSDAQGRTTFVNPAVSRMTGWSAEELMTAEAHELLHHSRPDGSPYPLDTCPISASLQRHEALHAMDEVFWRKDGTSFPVEYSSIPLVRDDELVGSVVTFTDITERKLAEQALLESERRYRELFETNPQPMWVYDLDTLRFLAVNEAAVRHYGYSRDEFLSMTIEDIRPAEDVPRMLASVERARNGVDHSEGWRHLTKRGDLIEVEVTSHALTWEGRAARLVISLDVTERKRAEEERTRTLEALRRTDEQRRKLLAGLTTAQEEERARIAGAVHDDTLQVMTAVGLRLEILGRSLEGEEQLRALDALQASVQDATGRLRRLLFELHPPALDRDGLAPALRTYLQHSHVEGGPAYQLTDRLRRQPSPESRVVLYRLAQEALTNVRKHARAARVDILLEERDHGFRVRVTDDGVGFRPEEAEAFRPGHLGMAAMRERLDRAGGRLRIDTEPGAGTTIEFWLPAEIPSA